MNLNANNGKRVVVKTQRGTQSCVDLAVPECVGASSNAIKSSWSSKNLDSAPERGLCSFIHARNCSTSAGIAEEENLRTFSADKRA